MALVAVAADKGAPGVTTVSLALAAVWPRPMLLAECDAAGGDLLYRLPAADGGRLDPQRGLLSLAVAARRGIQPHQVWRHTQKMHGGMDILTGLVNAEQAGGLRLLWGQVGTLLAEVPGVDVIADCGRLGPDGPFYDLLAHASAVLLVSRVTLEDTVRLRDRVITVARGLANRRLAGAPISVVVVAGRKHFKRDLAEVGQALAHSGAPARVLGGVADEPKSARMLHGQWGTRLDRSLLIRTAREIAARLARELPAPAAPQAPAAPPREAATAPAAAAPTQPPVAAGQAPPDLAPQPLPVPAEPARPAAPPEPVPAEPARADIAPPQPAALVPATGHPAACAAVPPEPAPPDPAVQAPAPLPAQDAVPAKAPLPGAIAAQPAHQAPGPADGDGPPQRRSARPDGSPGGQRAYLSKGR